jgi:Uma2 family endonuclease
MSQTLLEAPVDWKTAIENLVTEDDEPVENIPSAKQARLLVTPLYDNWTPLPNEDEPNKKRVFLADANVGVFSSPYQSPLVPNMFLSLDVPTVMDWHSKENRSYFIWEHERPPDVVVEIVSNRVGKELDDKLRRYAKLNIKYYVVFDPERLLSDDVLRVYECGFRRYRLCDDFSLPEIGLSLILWEGYYEGCEGVWLRWCDADGNMIPTAAERAEQESKRADKAEAENEQLRAELERLRQQLS